MTGGGRRDLGPDAATGFASTDEFGVTFSRPGDPDLGGSGGRALWGALALGDEFATLPLLEIGVRLDDIGSPTRARLAADGDSEVWAVRFAAPVEISSLIGPDETELGLSV